MYKLRPYQQEAVQATLTHFRKSKDPAVIVLPTGAGKSLVIAELARLAKGRVLVMAHVKELVEQNYQKYISFGLSAGIYSAGLQRKDNSEKVIFGSIQSIARAEKDFFNDFSLVVIDECHRVSLDGGTQYQQVLSELRKNNEGLCVLGLTATPYRLGLGWLYEYNGHKNILHSKKDRFFKKCIYELPLRYMVDEGYLTLPVKIDSPVACYDFSSLKLHGTRYIQEHLEKLLKDQSRITPLIIKNVLDMAKDRQGVMIFTSSVSHAEEIMKCLPPYVSALVIGDTDSEDRDLIIQEFKERKIKYLVNVSVLTTGFDAPHVDVIAILRPTESVSLYQQIVGRGLRLSEGKTDCLILDYTGQGHNIYTPEIENAKPTSDSQVVDVICPECGVVNNFWGIKDSQGQVKEHFGRKCKGAFEDPLTQEVEECGFLFRFKRCDQCGKENDISARVCTACSHVLVDNDKKLKEAMALKDAHVMRVENMVFRKSADRKGQERLEIHYYDADAQVLKEFFYLTSGSDHKAFYYNFARMHLKLPEKKLQIRSVDEVLKQSEAFRMPLFVIARKNKQFWAIREKIFE